MATQVQLRRGTSTQNDSFTGAQGELTFDTTNKRVRIHDGATAGGFELKTENAGGDTLFGDNEKAIFGAGSDLQIYHDPDVGSLITETGSGSLFIRASANIQLESASGENMAVFNENGAVQLFYDNYVKLATTSTGIDVTGTVTSDGLTVGGDVALIKTAAGANILSMQRNGAASPWKLAQGHTATNDFEILEGGTARLSLKSGGDISFYEDTGSTAKFFWDASAERLGIGTSSPSAKLSIAESTVGDLITVTGANGTDLRIGNHASANGGIYINSQAASDDLRFRTQGSDRMTIDSSGRVGIGTSSPAVALEIIGTTTSGIKIKTNSAHSNGFNLYWDSTTDTAVLNNPFSGAMLFETANTERLRIDSSGNVGIGTSSPDSNLHIEGSGSTTSEQLLSLVNGGGDAGAGSRLWISGTNATTRGTYIEGQAQGTDNRHDLIFATSGSGSLPSERMRIDSLGNVLVGTTNNTLYDTSTVTGSQISDGYIAIARPETSAFFNRLGSSDGEIVSFRKNGSPVGSIGVGGGGVLTIGQGSNYIQFHDSINSFYASDGSAGRDNAMNIGAPLVRFKDAYLSGGIYLGGTGSANKLDDYEEGTWTPTLLGASSNPTVGYLLQTGHYTKIGNTVNLYCRLQTNSRSGGSGTALIGGLPFAHNSARAGGSLGYISGVNLGSGFAQFSLSGDPVSSTIRYVQSGDNVGSNIINVTEVASTHDVVFTYTYQTNS